MRGKAPSQPQSLVTREIVLRLGRSLALPPSRPLAKPRSLLRVKKHTHAFAGVLYKVRNVPRNLQPQASGHDSLSLRGKRF